MKITSLHIKNFRGCRELNVPKIDKSLMLLGMNGAGKTSTLMALQWALTGQCYDKLGKPKKLAELIGASDKTAKVKLTIEHDGETFTLDCTAGVKASQIVLTHGETKVSGSEARHKLAALCGYDMTHVHASAHPHAYVLSDDLYVRLSELGSSLDTAKLEQHCGDKWPWLATWCKEVGAKLSSIEDLRKLGKLAYDERTHVNRDIKRLDLRLEELPKSNVNPDDLSKAKGLLLKLRQDRDVLLQQKARVLVGRSFETIKAEADQLEAELAAAPMPPDIGGLESAVENALREHSTINQKTYQLTTQITEIEKVLRGREDVCPTCKRAMPKDETIDREALKAKLAELEAEKAELNAQADRVLTENAHNREALSTARKQRDEIVATRARIQARLDAVLREKPAADFDESALTAIEGRIAKGEAMVDAMIKAAERKQVVESRAAAKHREQMLTWAVEQFRDGEAQAALGADAQAQFVEAVNAQLAVHGYSIKLRHEDSNLVAELWRSGRGYGASFYDVSDGELLIVQSVIAEALGCGFTIVDRVGDLDEGNRLTWFKRISGDRQYIFAATWVKPGLPNVDAVSKALGCTVAWLERDEMEAAA